jgi:hypothetical protein
MEKLSINKSSSETKKCRIFTYGHIKTETNKMYTYMATVDKKRASELFIFQSNAISLSIFCSLTVHTMDHRTRYKNDQFNAPLSQKRPPKQFF